MTAVAETAVGVGPPDVPLSAGWVVQAFRRPPLSSHNVGLINTTPLSGTTRKFRVTTVLVTVAVWAPKAASVTERIDPEESAVVARSPGTTSNIAPPSSWNVATL